MAKTEHKVIPINTRQFRCSSCVGLHRTALIGKTPCNEQGILDTSKSCSKFIPDSSQMTSKESHQALVALIEGIRNLPTNLVPHITTMLMAHDQINRYLRGRYNLLERVVLKFRGREQYLSNYCYAYIVDANSTGVKLVGAMGNVMYSCDYASFRTMAQKEDDFNELREQLIHSNRLYDPALDPLDRKVIRDSMRRTGETDAPDLQAAVDTEAFDSDTLAQANLSELLQELSDHGTVSRTSSKEARRAKRWKDAESNNAEDYDPEDEEKRANQDDDDEELEPTTGTRSHTFNYNGDE